MVAVTTYSRVAAQCAQFPRDNLGDTYKLPSLHELQSLNRSPKPVREKHFALLSA